MGNEIWFGIGCILFLAAVSIWGFMSLIAYWLGGIARAFLRGKNRD